MFPAEIKAYHEETHGLHQPTRYPESMGWADSSVLPDSMSYQRFFPHMEDAGLNGRRYAPPYHNNIGDHAEMGITSLILLWHHVPHRIRNVIGISDFVPHPNHISRHVE